MLLDYLREAELGCFLIATEDDGKQISSTKSQLKNSRQVTLDTGWKVVPGDKRYEEKIVKYEDGRTTRMTRVLGQKTDGDYPHYTEFYQSGGGKKHFDNDPRWDSHYSASKTSTRYGTHRTPTSLLNALGISIKK